MEVLKYIMESVLEVIKSFFIHDTDVISIDTKKILENPIDKELFFTTIDQLNALSKMPEFSNNRDKLKKTITLSDNSTITLTL